MNFKGNSIQKILYEMSKSKVQIKMLKTSYVLTASVTVGCLGSIVYDEG